MVSNNRSRLELCQSNLSGCSTRLVVGRVVWRTNRGNIAQESVFERFKKLNKKNFEHIFFALKIYLAPYYPCGCAILEAKLGAPYNPSLPYRHRFTIIWIGLTDCKSTVDWIQSQFNWIGLNSVKKRIAWFHF